MIVLELLLADIPIFVSTDVTEGSSLYFLGFISVKYNKSQIKVIFK